MNNQETKGDILIVDDVPENLQLLFTMLTEQHYEVRRVLSGKQALNVVKIDPPDLILLDIKMPDLDGYQVCEQLKENSKTKDIPVIFLSALNDTFDKVKAFEVGGVDYIAKPFQLQEVLVRVENQLKLLQMQRQLQGQNEELQSLNQELKAFKHRLSYDLRNNLNTINCSSYLLNQKYADLLDQKGKTYLKSICEEGIRMQELIEDLLRLSEFQDIQMVLDPFNLSKMVEKIVNQLLSQEEKQSIEFIIEPEIFVRGDQRLIKLALENLIRNGIKYTSKTKKPRIEFGQLKTNHDHAYFIKDNGIGFEPNQSENLLVSFQPLDQDFDETEIRLATVQRIIQRHGGKIWYEGQVNQGATFYFTLG